MTTDTRLTSMTAVAIPQAGLLSAPVTRQARLLVETPLLSLPPVLNNSLIVVITNKTQSLKVYEGELFRLDLMNPVEELSNIFYPDNGLISMELDGNNVFDPSQIGSWTNRLSNTALTDNWFQQGDLADPPVLPSGCTYAGTRFDVEICRFPSPAATAAWLQSPPPRSPPMPACCCSSPATAPIGPPRRPSPEAPGLSAT